MAPAKKTPEVTPPSGDDFDDLLELDEDVQSSPTAVEDSPLPATVLDPEDIEVGTDLDISAAEPILAPVQDAPVSVDELVETPAERRIRELEEKLEAATNALLAAAAAQPAPTPQLTQAEKEAQHALAAKETARIDKAPVQYVEDEGAEKILIHVLEDGLTAFGHSWSKGQEFEVAVGSPNYQRTVNSQGVSWLDLRNDPNAQRRKWGKVMFGEGEYPWRDGEEFDLDAAHLDARRRRAVPATY